jgi:uncharacterized protein (DUF305 family)
LKTGFRRMTAARLLLLFTLAGCAASAPGDEAERVPSSEQQRLEALYWDRVRADLGSYEPADVVFMTGMIGHHAQALVMSALAEPNGASPAVRTLAARIANAQADEIASMQRWLRDRGEPVPTVDIQGIVLTVGIEGEDAAAVDAHAAHDHHDMPGMLSQAQLERLAAARGALFDRLFLAFMIQHHGGAVVMVDDLLEAGGATADRATFKLASDIRADQTTEVARMQQMLDALGGAPDAAAPARSGHGHH